MAGAFQDQEKGFPGEPLVLDAQFRLFEGGPLTDTDVLPTYQIFDPNSSLAASGTGTQTGTGTYTATFNIPSTAELSNRWRIEWTAAIHSTPVKGAKEYFSVCNPKGDSVFHGGTQIIMDQGDLNQVKKVLAYPSVPNVLLFDEEIKQLCVLPAMTKYFSKFPIPKRDQVNFNSYIEVDFPDDLTFGILDLRTTNKLSATGSVNSSFWEIVKYRNLYGTTNTRWNGQYGTKYNFNGYMQNLITKRQVYDTLSNDATYAYNVNYPDRKVEVFASSQCDLTMTWAKYSNNFNDVKYTYKYDVIELAQAYLLLHLADTGGMVSDSDLTKQINTEALKTRANEMIDKVMKEKWELIPDVILLRQS
jgi:hypothetical protein